MLRRRATYSLSNLTLHYWIGESDPNDHGERQPGIFKNDNLYQCRWSTP